MISFFFLSSVKSSLPSPSKIWIVNNFFLSLLLGLGQTGATGLTDFFMFWCYVTPILGAIISDQYLGKYNTIVYFSFVYLLGVLILFLTSLPVSIEHGAALPGLIVAMIIIGLGTGGIKSNVSPLIAEQ